MKLILKGFVTALIVTVFSGYAFALSGQDNDLNLSGGLSTSGGGSSDSSLKEYLNKGTANELQQGSIGGGASSTEGDAKLYKMTPGENEARGTRAS